MLRNIDSLIQPFRIRFTEYSAGRLSTCFLNILSCDNILRGKCFQGWIAHLMKVACGQTTIASKAAAEKKRGVVSPPYSYLRQKRDGQCILMKHCTRHQKNKTKHRNQTTTNYYHYCNRLPGATEKSMPLEYSETVQAKPKIT